MDFSSRLIDKLIFLVYFSKSRLYFGVAEAESRVGVSKHLDLLRRVVEMIRGNSITRKTFSKQILQLNSF